jgi:peptide alpha-N-acetyltransferase
LGITILGKIRIVYNLQVMNLIDNELSEPYSIFTYRFFLRNWPDLCFLAFDQSGHCFGCVVSKMEPHKEVIMRGYIGMLTVEKAYRHLGVGKPFEDPHC